MRKVVLCVLVCLCLLSGPALSVLGSGQGGEGRASEEGGSGGGEPLFDPVFEDPVLERAARQYELPIDLSNVSGLDRIDCFANLDESQRRYLSENGLVRTGSSDRSDVIALYSELKHGDLPIYVTTDSMLHLYHVLFDDILMRLEEAYLRNMSIEMTRALLEEAIDVYGAVDGQMTYVHLYEAETIGGPVTYTITEVIDLKEAARMNVAFLSVALRLADPSATTPEYVQREVDAELALIDAHEGFNRSPLFDKSAVHRRLVYEEDYSQYKPRGHYTRTEELASYFKQMMWYGRMSFRLKSGVETVQAILLAECMQKALWARGTAQELWDLIYLVTSFFVGASDDLTPMDYAALTAKTFGDLGADCSGLLDADLLDEYRDGLQELRRPRICSNFVRVDLEDQTNATMGMRLMGQRFIPDSYIFQGLVFPSVGMYEGDGTPFTLSLANGGGPIKGFPRGMEAMAVLGSEIAEDFLVKDGDVEYANYSQRFGKLKAEFEALGDDVFSQNLYWGWLYTLKSLNGNFSGEGYPTYMRGRAYMSQKLNTVLGSWSELRHDTILYAKQSYTGAGGGSQRRDVGYVEPIPAFYSRLRALTDATADGLSGLGVLDGSTERDLECFSGVLERLGNISMRELAGEALSDKDGSFITSIGSALGSIFEDVTNGAGDSRLVADVHTDPNTDPTDGVLNKCLEEAVGTFDMVIVVVADADGTLGAFTGPIFSYYEFKQEISERLTDEEWRAILEAGTDVPERFDWMDYPPRLGGICGPAPSPDVGIVTGSVQLTVDRGAHGVGVLVTATAFNRWNADVPATVTFHLDEVDEEHLLGSHDVVIPAMDVAPVTERWDLREATICEHTVIVTVRTEAFSDVKPSNDVVATRVDLAGMDDLDGDGSPNEADAFPLDRAASTDTDGDGHPDAWNPGSAADDSTSVPALTLDAFPLDPAASLDADGDGSPDAWNPGMGPDDSTSDPRLELDAFPLDPTEWADADGDGRGDNSDAFPADPAEWADADGDGRGDNSDAFPADPAEWADADGDGWGDNGDAFPSDPKEWADVDGDGRGDNDDAFPTDSTEWVDADGDGRGDNTDKFPSDATEWSDVDGDGRGDNGDAFPTDPAEWADADSDGRGDNSDAFPNDPSEWTDTDTDGIGDNADRFPGDPAASVDVDGDGHPDVWNPGMSQEDSTTGLELDHYPMDGTRWRAEAVGDAHETPVLAIILSIASTGILLVALIVHYRHRRAAHGRPRDGEG